jgi:hypothetical protein
VYGGDIYSDYPSSLHHLAAHGATTDPWQYAQVIYLYLCSIFIHFRENYVNIIHWKKRLASRP